MTASDITDTLNVDKLPLVYRCKIPQRCRVLAPVGQSPVDETGGLSSSELCLDYYLRFSLRFFSLSSLNNFRVGSPRTCRGPTSLRHSRLVCRNLACSLLLPVTLLSGERRRRRRSSLVGRVFVRSHYMHSLDVFTLC